MFCHTPHNAAPGAQGWNRRTRSTTYTPYTSSTLKSAPGQPNGSSLLCLSCHDGTVALGEMLSRGAPVQVAGGKISGSALLGTDLSDDHPVSFVYDSMLRSRRGELADPATLAKPSRVRLDSSGRLQCTTCHDPHDDRNGNFLVVANTASALCRTCHVKNDWASSGHRNSTRSWNGAGVDPWPHTAETTVAANACESCHRPHTAGGSKRLLNHAQEEANCYACHNGNVAQTNIQAEFNKPSRHAVASYTGVHDPTEPASTSVRHVECVDCHNPHATNGSDGSLPGAPNPVLPGSLAGTRGISIGGTTVASATYEYEICFRCHGDGAANVPSPRTPRQISQNNKRLEFQTTNPSYHPVAGAGRSSLPVPSLVAPWNLSSRVLCSDCHNNNAGPGAGGNGPNGPHGSTYSMLLKRQYLVADNTSESAGSYALCYECHDRTSILADASFKEHKKHIVDERTPCNVCHDPHGISATQGNSLNNSRLINFDTSIVKPNGSGLLKFESTGTNAGRCYLSCHGESHDPLSYGP